MNVLLSSDEIVGQLPEYAALAHSIGATGVHYMKFQADSLEFGNPPDLTRHTDVIKSFRDEARCKGLIVTGTCSDAPTFVECDDAFTCPYVLLNDDVYGCTYMANLRMVEVYCGREYKVPSRSYAMGNLNDNEMREIWGNGRYTALRNVLKSTRQPNGAKIRPSELVVIKDKSVEGFNYCLGCLCRWGESGL
jgi:hypothetical protein